MSSQSEVFFSDLPPVSTNPNEWRELMRRYHWRRSFECYKSEQDNLADYHRKQAQIIERRMRDGQ